MRSRQEQLEADLQRAWSQDPLALMGFAQPEKGTKKVHEKRERPNLIYFQSIRLVEAVGMES